MSLNMNIRKFKLKEEKIHVFITNIEQGIILYKLSTEEEKVSFLATSFESPELEKILKHISPKVLKDYTFEELTKICLDVFSKKKCYLQELYRFMDRNFDKEKENIRDFYDELNYLADELSFPNKDRRLTEKLAYAVRSEKHLRSDLLKIDFATKKSSDLLDNIALHFDNVEALFKKKAVNNIEVKKTCKNCRRNHDKGRCPAKNITCFNCQEVGHFVQACPLNYRKNKYEKDHKHRHEDLQTSDESKNKSKAKSRRSSRKHPKEKEVNKNHYISTDDESTSNTSEDNNSDVDVSETESMYNLTVENEKSTEIRNPNSDFKTIHNVTVDYFNEKQGPLLLNVNLDKQNVQFEADSGAAITTINEIDFKMLNKPLLPDRTALRAYNGDSVKVLGKVICRSLKIGKKRAQNVRLIVVKGNKPNLMGRDLLIKLGILQIDINKLDEDNYKNEELKPIKDFKCRLYIKPNSKPVFNKPRPVPFQYKDKIEQSINEMIKNKVISKVQFSDYAAPIVPVLKPNDSIRVCVDFKRLNQVMETIQYPLPNIDDMLVELEGYDYYSKID